MWQIRESSFEHVRSFLGHTRSVKTAAFRKTDPACFATGGRDGVIQIWDIRSRSKADNVIHRGHEGGPGTPQAYKRRATTRQTPKLPPNASSSSITGLVFQDDYTLVSCGAGDGIIKVWDLRRNYSSFKGDPLPKHRIPYPGSSTFKGFTNLAIDSTGQRLYVNCMDHNIYCYNLGVYATQPLMSYTGLTNSTFYIKSSLSPDDQYLISGSSDEKAFVWNVNSSRPLLTLVGHTVEVTCVAWGRTNDMRIVTCSDDARHKIWRLNSDNVEDDTRLDYRGQAEPCMEYKNCPLKVKLKALENTPKSLKRLMERNETTPSSMEKIATKRTYSDLCHCDSAPFEGATGGDTKRQLIETRARRLFGPSTSTGTSSSVSTSFSRYINNEFGFRRLLPEIHEELTTELLSPKSHTSDTTDHSDKFVSPLNERSNYNHIEMRTPSSSFIRPSSSIGGLFSPTSNLPNYVVDGDAPHLKLQSPKRKLKENVDWLTKIRKQKLQSTINSQLNDKLNGQSSSQNDQSHIGTHDGPSTSANATASVANELHSVGILSPRMQKLKSSDRPPYNGFGSSPTRRMSSCHQQSVVEDAKRTPSRRNSETTILRFFSAASPNPSQAGVTTTSSN